MCNFEVLGDGVSSVFLSIKILEFDIFGVHLLLNIIVSEHFLHVFT